MYQQSMIKNVLLFSYEIFIVTAEKIYSASFCNDDFKCSFSQTDVKKHIDGKFNCICQ